MKTISLSLMLLFLLNVASGQTLSVKDFYFSAPLFINPAMAGESDDPTLTLISHLPSSDVIQIGEKVFKRQAHQAYGYRSAAFMLQVSPKRRSTTTMRR